MVRDSHQALADLGAYVRSQLDLKVAAITGSCGKTSVKEMLASILGREGKALATRGNLNNEIGVPLTLLELTEEHQYAVIELGANHAGEIAFTTALTRPDVAVVTNVSAAHLEGFGSLQGVADAKFEIFQGLGKEGIAVLNRKQYDFENWHHKLAIQPQLGFALEDPDSDLYADAIEMQASGCRFMLHTPKGAAEVRLRVPGRHNVANALAAAGTALALGIPLETIVAGLEAFDSVPGRLQRTELKDCVVIDDSYNASADSVSAAIEVLKEMPGYRIFVFGDMAELGDESDALHQRIGRELKASGIEQVLLLGDKTRLTAKECQGHWYSDKPLLIKALEQLITEQKDVVILVKGARSMKMDEVVTVLTNNEEMAC